MTKTPIGILRDYVKEHTVHSGEYGIDVHFFKVMPVLPLIPADEFRAMILAAGRGEFTNIDSKFLAQGPSYIEFGGWLGDQGLALCFMALGEHFGLWKVITPAFFGLTGVEAATAAGNGLLLVSGWKEQV
jgi:hypothetical protein